MPAPIKWTSNRPPKCFDRVDEWRAWSSSGKDGAGVRSPCADCNPAHRDRMHAIKRCERPETLFVVDPMTGEVLGISSDESRYAALVRGKVGQDLQVWPWLERSRDWKRRLMAARRYASSAAKVAIESWLRSFA